MPRRTKLPPDSPALWPLEAEPSELHEYVTSRVQPGNPDETPSDAVLIEPAWFREAFDTSWPQIVTDPNSW